MASDQTIMRAAAAPGADDARVRDILNAMPQMVWSTRADGYHDFYNDRWYEFTGMIPGSTDGEGWNGMFHPDDQVRAWDLWRHSLATGEPYEIEYRLRHHTGAYRWALGRALAVRDADGAVQRWFGTCTDIDDLKRAQGEWSKLASIVDQSADFIGIADADCRLQYVNIAGRRLVGLDDGQDPRSTPITALLTPEGARAIHDIVLPAVEADGRWVGELGLRHLRTGEVIPVLCNIFPVRDAAGKGWGYATTTRDLRERKSSEEALELVARELSHRIKNIFSVVSSLVAVSARGHPDAQPFADAVAGRIEALAQAHEYVRPHSPESRASLPGQTVQGLLQTLLEPYREAGVERIRVSGSDAPVGVRSATSLALVFHELATNAVKYGALSDPVGTVDIRCEQQDGSFSITWLERGGPAVAGPPARRGFGTRMSERVVSAQLQAAIAYDWDPAGLSVRLVAPVASISRA